MKPMKLDDYLDRPVPLIELVERWPHQLETVERVGERIEAGARRIAVTTPTGGGKTLSMADLLLWWLRTRDSGVSLLTNRKILIDQLVKGMEDYGIDFGVRAAGRMPDSLQRFQISSIQTEDSRVVKRKKWDAAESGLVIVDEAHVNNNTMTNRVLAGYPEAVKVGFTATPIGLEGGYDELLVCGTNSELRDCGAIVPAVHHGCDEPDLANIRRIPVGEVITEKQERKLIMVPGIHGRVIDEYRRLNPRGLATMGFAPGVAESVGFAEAFEEAGIPAAHIDGDHIWIRGHEARSTPARRRELFELSRTGQIRVVWCRFVLREAVDMPWMRHVIFATVFGSLTTYLQSGGRGLRACLPVGKRDVSVQDHGGNWWRYGSLNENRNWRLSDTNRVLAGERQDNLAGVGDTPPREPEPFVCPKCKCVLVLRELLLESTKVTCPCGAVWDFGRRSRIVIQSDGTLVEHHGRIFNPRRTERRPDTLDHWKACYWRTRKSGGTFSQAAGLFYKDHGYMPPRDLPMMPRTNYQWYLKVAAVPYGDLYQNPDREDDR